MPASALGAGINIKVVIKMQKNHSDWLFGLKHGVQHFVDGLMMPDAPFGRFRMADKGCNFLPYDILSVHYAADIYAKLHLDKKLSPEQKKQWIELSLGWIDKKTGEVQDADGLERFFDGSEEMECKIAELRRNLNRCCHGVFEAGAANHVLQQDARKFLDINVMCEIFNTLPWDTGAWAAGAQAAHYVLAMYEWVHAGHQEFVVPLEKAVEYLYAKQNPEDGTFGGRGQSDANLIGGMLKIGIRLFVTLGRELRYPERMIDTAIRMLRSGNLKGNCPAHNALIVLEMCGNFTDYRSEDIKDEAWKSLERDIIPLYKHDGGFCGNPDTSEYWIWNVKMVNEGYNQSNLHSTHIMLNAVRVIAEIVGVESTLDFAASDYRRQS